LISLSFVDKKVRRSTPATTKRFGENEFRPISKGSFFSVFPVLLPLTCSLKLEQATTQVGDECCVLIQERSQRMN
jgi:hypothetical protein